MLLLLLRRAAATNPRSVWHGRICSVHVWRGRVRTPPATTPTRNDTQRSQTVGRPVKQGRVCSAPTNILLQMLWGTYSQQTYSITGKRPTCRLPTYSLGGGACAPHPALRPSERCRGCLHPLRTAARATLAMFEVYRLLVIHITTLGLRPLAFGSQKPCACNSCPKKQAQRSKHRKTANNECERQRTRTRPN